MDRQPFLTHPPIATAPCICASVSCPAFVLCRNCTLTLSMPCECTDLVHACRGYVTWTRSGHSGQRLRTAVTDSGYGQRLRTAVTDSVYGQRLRTAITDSGYGHRLRTAVTDSGYGQRSRTAVTDSGYGLRSGHPGQRAWAACPAMARVSSHLSLMQSLV
jgi:hypothetical protein